MMIYLLSRIQEKHAEITTGTDGVRLRPLDEDCRVLVNGIAAQTETVLHHDDRLIFGSTQIWVFQNPTEPRPEISPVVTTNINYEFVLQEMAANSGFSLTTTSGSSNTDKGVVILLYNSPNSKST